MEKTNKMLKLYLNRLVFRAAVFIAVLTIYFIDKQLLDFTSGWSKTNIFGPTGILYLVILIEMLIQINPRSKVSRGCLKQFERYFKETDIDYDKAEMKNTIHQKNLGAIKVLIVWVAFNLVFGLLYFKKIIGAEEILLICAAYYLCDLICIIFVCPFQKFLMKNRCCVTCRIFAWGHAMMTTPLVFVKHFYSWSLFGFALFVAAKWEYTFFKHPERFLETVNVNLNCINCTDKLCEMKS
jgi:hypothetical protein